MQVACVYELRAGQGQATLGGDGPNIENWRAVLTLRAHSGNVTDLAWYANLPNIMGPPVDVKRYSSEVFSYIACSSILRCYSFKQIVCGHAVMLRGFRTASASVGRLRESFATLYHYYHRQFCWTCVDVNRVERCGCVGPRTTRGLPLPPWTTSSACGTPPRDTELPCSTSTPILSR